MANSAQLKQERQDKIDALDVILKAAEDDNGKATRDFTDDEANQILSLRQEVERLDGQIETQLAIEAAQKERAERARPKQRKTPEQKVTERYSLLKAIRAMDDKNFPNEKLEGVEKEMHDEASREARSFGQTLKGVGIPAFMTRADLAAGGATTGGDTVQTDVAGLVPFLYPRMVVEDAGATVLTGLSGDYQIPINDATGSVTWEGEADAAAATDPTFNKITLTPKRLAGYTRYSKQLLAQSSISVENMVRNNLSRLIGNEIDDVAIEGGGANEPSGITQKAGIGDVAGGTNGAVPTWANIVELETDVATADADFGRLAYITTPGIRGTLKQTEKATNTGMFIWNDSTMATSSTGPVGELNGYRAFASTLVPSDLTKGTGTNLHAIIFGDFSELILAFWGGVDLVVDPYSQVLNAQIQVVANVFVDVGIPRAGKFSAMLDAALS